MNYLLTVDKIKRLSTNTPDKIHTRKSNEESDGNEMHNSVRQRLR